MMNDALLCCFNIETLCMWYLSFVINFFRCCKVRNNDISPQYLKIVISYKTHHSIMGDFLSFLTSSLLFFNSKSIILLL